MNDLGLPFPTFNLVLSIQSTDGWSRAAVLKFAGAFSQSLQMPCFIGDKVTIEGEVIDKSQSTRILTIKTTIHNQDNTCLVDGIAKVIVNENIAR